MTAPLPDLRAGDTDAKIRSTVGPEFVTTRRPPPSAITNPAGPQFVKNNRPAGASSGDHTQTFLPRCRSEVSDDEARLAPARSSAGGWPGRDARRRPRTGTPSRRSSQAAAQAPVGLTSQVADVPKHLGGAGMAGADTEVAVKGPEQSCGRTAAHVAGHPCPPRLRPGGRSQDQ